MSANSIDVTLVCFDGTDEPEHSITLYRTVEFEQRPILGELVNGLTITSVTHQTDGEFPGRMTLELAHAPIDGGDTAAFMDNLVGLGWVVTAIGAGFDGDLQQRYAPAS